MIDTPRLLLKKMVAAAADQGYRIKTGVECEFFLLSGEAHQISDSSDRAAKPCYDQQALMRRYEVISEICDGMAVTWLQIRSAPPKRMSKDLGQLVAIRQRIEGRLLRLDNVDVGD